MIFLIAAVLMMFVGAIKLSNHSPALALVVVFVALVILCVVLFTPGLMS